MGKEAAIIKKGDPILHRPGYEFFRRLQDIVFSLLGILFLSPLLLLLPILVFLDDPHGSPIFSQLRIGKDGKTFKLYKFRSMHVDAEERLSEVLDRNEMTGPAFKIKDDPRITKVGRFIRKTSLDELPQLFNILMGDMSIVGPRPPLPREVEQYTAYQKQRLLITPGLTCIWQIQPGRNSIPFDQWVDLDLKYIKERSFLLDWKLIFGTVKAVLRGQGE